MVHISPQELVDRTMQLLDVADGEQLAFRGAQFDAGLAWVHFPIGRGGLGQSPAKQVIVDDVLRAAGVLYDGLDINPMGIGMAAPTILAYGTEAMERRFLRRLFTGEEIWCQLFSEPTNGSDAAGIASRAVRDGDEWVVNGQKVWTTLAHLARWGLLLVRTNPDAPKHRGLSYFVLDMHAPGVEVRPLLQMTGEAEFNEVFLSDVRIPHDAMLGAEGEGWKVATTTLMNERVALGGGVAGKGDGPIRTLGEIWAQERDRLSPAVHAASRSRVASLWAEAEILRLTNQRAKALAATGIPGPQGSIGKLLSAELHRRIYETCVDLLGPTGMLHETGYPMARPTHPRTSASASSSFLRSPALTIEGGTSEIMRNILGERVLGLPGEPRGDKEVPWSEIPR